MAKTCFCCGKKAGFIDSDLQNGKICDDCFDKALKENGNLTRFNISKYSGEEITAIINQDKEALAHPENFAPHISKAEKSAKQAEAVQAKMVEWALLAVGVIVAIIVITQILG